MKMQRKLSHKRNIFQDDYEEIEEIGRGCFGTVHRIRRKSDGRSFVWKKICYENMTQQEKIQIVNEENVLRKLNHRNIIKYIDRLIDKQNQHIYIIMEHCDEGDLCNYLKKKRKTSETIDENIAISIFIQLLDALHYCHTRNNKVLHRDIKPQNIFLLTPKNKDLLSIINEGSYLNNFLDEKNKDTETNTIIVKLGDFGLARYLSGSNQLATTHVGTPYYMSPEVLGKGQYNEKSDIWSLGCCIYEIVMGKPPFYARSYDELRKHVNEGTIKSLPEQYSREFNDILKLMFERDPIKRPSAEEIFRLDFIRRKMKILSNRIELSFMVYEYQKLLSYNYYLESMFLKSEYISTKKTEQSDVSTLDASIDSNTSNNCQNNENLSNYLNLVPGNENGVASNRNEGRSHLLKKEMKIGVNVVGDEEKLFYITPKRKPNDVCTKSQNHSASSVNIYNCRTSRRLENSPVTVPTRSVVQKNKSYTNKQNYNQNRDNKNLGDRREVVSVSPISGKIESRNFEDERHETQYSRIGRAFTLERSMEFIGKNVDRNTPRKTDKFVFESEERLSRWIEKFHYRNRSHL